MPTSSKSSILLPHPCPAHTIVVNAPAQAHILISPGPGVVEITAGTVVGEILKALVYLGLRLQKMFTIAMSTTKLSKLGISMDEAAMNSIDRDFVSILALTVEHDHGLLATEQDVHRLIELYLTSAIQQASPSEFGGAVRFYPSAIARNQTATTMKDCHKRFVSISHIVSSGILQPSSNLVQHRWQWGQSEAAIHDRRPLLIESRIFRATNNTEFQRKIGSIGFVFCAIQLSKDISSTPLDQSLTGLTETCYPKKHKSADNEPGMSKLLGRSKSQMSILESIAFEALQTTTRSAKSPLSRFLSCLTGCSQIDKGKSVSHLHQTKGLNQYFEIIALKLIQSPLDAVAKAELQRSATCVGVAHGGMISANSQEKSVERKMLQQSDTLILLLKTEAKHKDSANALSECFSNAAREAWANGSPDGMYCSTILLKHVISIVYVSRCMYGLFCETC